MRRTSALILSAALLCAATAAFACFGAELRVGVPSDAPGALAAYATGYFVEEKTGIAPDFREVTGDPATMLAEGDIDIWLVPVSTPTPEGFLTRPAGTTYPLLYGLGTALPVIAFAVLIALGVQSLGRWLRGLQRLEFYIRIITGVLFVAVGLYYIWLYWIL